MARGAKAWHPNRAGPLCPASGDAGSAEAMESDVLPIQLWVPTASVGASRRGSSAAVHCARQRMGDRSRFGKILRSSQSRQTDGPNCQTDRGQAAVEAHPGISECRGDGERTGQSECGRHSARRTAFATAKIGWVLEADLKNFFGSLNHDWVLRFVAHRAGDPRLISLIRRWLKAGVLEDGAVHPSEQGTPQGGSISVLLSNLYLHYVLDLWFERVVKG